MESSEKSISTAAFVHLLRISLLLLGNTNDEDHGLERCLKKTVIDSLVFFSLFPVQDVIITNLISKLASVYSITFPFPALCKAL